MKNLFYIGLIASTMLSSSVFAQTSDDPAPIPGHARINEVDKRLENQQDRIDAGLKDGKITKAQAIRDENRDQKVDQQLISDEAKNGGHITKAEQKQMNHELNANSKDINTQRHEIDPGHPRVSEVDQRLANQQKREDAGLADGQISKKQFIRDENRDQKIEQQLSADEAKNGGHITKGEQKQLNKELNTNSKKIYKQRHSKKKKPE